MMRRNLLELTGIFFYYFVSMSVLTRNSDIPCEFGLESTWNPCGFFAQEGVSVLYTGQVKKPEGLFEKE